MSGVLSNTGTAAVLIPVVIGIAAKSGYSRSRLLMPLVFAAAMGGTPNDKISSSQESKTILFDSVETIGYGASTPEEAAADTINLLSGLEQ